MNEPSVERVVVDASPEEIWSILEDPAALGRVLPDAESVVADGPNQVRVVLASRVAFMTVRADLVGRYLEADPPRHLRLVLDGAARGVPGEIHASIPFDLRPLATAGTLAPARTEVRYAVGLELTGRLASMAGPMIRRQIPEQVAALVRNVEREAIRRRTA
ncbi:MAG TPA: SRPBCC domain-containing protein [Candidatus Limnocylindrales bacterium]|nr:SRPBCC domain-containing protein [Candidatus Limnocylindrales bacterium]